MFDILLVKKSLYSAVSASSDAASTLYLHRHCWNLSNLNIDSWCRDPFLPPTAATQLWPLVLNFSLLPPPSFLTSFTCLGFFSKNFSQDESSAFRKLPRASVGIRWKRAISRILKIIVSLSHGQGTPGKYPVSASENKTQNPISYSLHPINCMYVPKLTVESHFKSEYFINGFIVHKNLLEFVKNCHAYRGYTWKYTKVASSLHPTGWWLTISPVPSVVLELHLFTDQLSEVPAEVGFFINVHHRG